MQTSPHTNVSARIASSTLALKIITIVIGYNFFFSGFSSLVFQVAWQRMLGLFAGSDVRAVTIIVGAYLAGIGFGSLLGSLIADRFTSRQAVLLFGLCDVGIGLFAFASRFIFYDLLFVRLNSLAASSGPLLLASFIGLLVPTVLMGLSLPLLSKALVRNIADAPQLIGRFYAINTLGAGAGAFLAGRYLLGLLGFEYAVYLGGAISVVIGIITLLLVRYFPRDEQPAQRERRFGLGTVPSAVWGWCGLMLASGFVAISLELVWFRLLSVIVESRAHTFSHMLAFVLMGYGIGSWAGARLLPRVRHPRRLFLLVQAAAVIYTLASVLLIYLGHNLLAPLYANPFGAASLGSSAMLGAQQLLFGYLVLPALLLLPPNILIGMNFPIAQYAVQTDMERLGQRLGLIQMAGILGNTAGSILTGLLLFDLVGTAGALRLVGLIGLAFLMLLLWMQRREAAVHRAAGFGAVTALALGVALFPGNNAFWTRMHDGTSTNTIVAEDSTGVSVIRSEGDQAAIFANGTVQGEVPFLPIHQTLGVLSAAAHPAPSEVLIIGVGSAGTPYAAALSPDTRRVTAVEIVGSELPVLEAAAERPWGRPLQAFFSDPRINVVVGDGRRVLAHSRQRYDLIQADAIQPWRSHSGMLYSQEFFTQARERLTEGGIMAQWAPTERTLHTFMAVFPYGINIGDILLLGSNEPIDPDSEAWLARLADPRVQEHLQKGNISADYARAFLQNHAITPWTPETPRSDNINTDLWPRDEYGLW